MTPEDIEAIAQRVVELTREHHDAPRIVNARELAEYLGVSVDVIYANAGLLGAIRLGDGPRPRLRFAIDGHQVQRWIERSTPEPTPEPTPIKRRTRRARPAVDLLPIEGEAA